MVYENLKINEMTSTRRDVSLYDVHENTFARTPTFFCINLLRNIDRRVLLHKIKIIFHTIYHSWQ